MAQTMTGSRKDGTTFPCDVTSTVSDSGEAVFIVRNNQFEAGISSALSQMANPGAGTVIVTVSGGPVCEDDPGECPALGEVVSITGNVAVRAGVVCLASARLRQLLCRRCWGTLLRSWWATM